MCSFQSDSLSHFTLQKLATAAENFQMEYQWKDEFEVTATQKYSNTHPNTYRKTSKSPCILSIHLLCMYYAICG